jgi:hypothetical protein
VAQATQNGDCLDARHIPSELKRQLGSATRAEVDTETILRFLGSCTFSHSLGHGRTRERCPRLVRLSDLREAPDRQPRYQIRQSIHERLVDFQAERRMRKLLAIADKYAALTH